MPDAHGRYDFVELTQLWVQAGGNPKHQVIAACVALAESGGNPTAGPTNSNGSQDRGLWQINSSHGALSSFDPATNARAAVQISGDGVNWRPWCTAWSDNACGTKGGSYGGSGSSVGKIYADVTGSTGPDWVGNSGKGVGPIPGLPGSGKPPKGPAQDAADGTTDCQHKVDLKVATICMDKTIAGATMAAGGVLILAGVAVIVVAAFERTAAGRAATKAIAVPAGAALGAKAAVSRRSAARTATAGAAEEQSRRRAREDAAETRRAEAHTVRMSAATSRARGARSHPGPNADRSTREVIAGNRRRAAARPTVVERGRAQGTRRGPTRAEAGTPF